MGNQCNRLNQLAIAAEYPLMRPILHPAFGHILHLQSDTHRNEKALKKIACPSQQTLDTLKTRTEFATECDNSISTLIQIYQYQLVDTSSPQAALWNKFQNKSATCNSLQTSFIIIHFQYFPIDCSLTLILQTRTQSLQKLRRKYGHHMLAAANDVRLCDYKQIDKLQAQSRQIVNHYYQQIEIVRMIDHLVGALYFLHHFNVPHGAVRLETILVDAEGKFVLVDRELFDIRSNYEVALEFGRKMGEKDGLFGEKSQREGVEFLAPECLIDLKQKSPFPTTNLQKIDIYCVGVLALRMCLIQIDKPLFEFNKDRKYLKLNEQELNLRLLAVQKRYSSKLTQLLSKMLERDPRQRYDFTQLIDNLNPLLLKNLQSIKQLHTPKQPTKLQSQADMVVSQPFQKNQLKQKLASIEQQFQRVMNNRTMLLHRTINEKQIKDEQDKILKKLEKIKMVRSAFQSTEPPASKRNHLQKYTPQIKNFSLSGGTSQMESPKIGTERQEGKRYLSGKEFEEMVRHQYENIKSKRG